MFVDMIYRLFSHWHAWWSTSKAEKPARSWFAHCIASLFGPPAGNKAHRYRSRFIWALLLNSKAIQLQDIQIDSNKCNFQCTNKQIEATISRQLKSPNIVKSSQICECLYWHGKHIHRHTFTSTPMPTLTQFVVTSNHNLYPIKKERKKTILMAFNGLFACLLPFYTKQL